MKDRIKNLRRTLNLTQQEFADKIGVKRNTIGQYEIGRNKPIDSIINLICREFNVNEEWLRTGKGEMFLPEANGELEALVKKYNLSYNEKIIIEKFVKMSEADRQVVLNYCTEIANALSDDNALETTKTKSFSKQEQELNSFTIDEMVESYRQELEAEEKAREKSAALQKNA